MFKVMQWLVWQHLISVTLLILYWSAASSSELTTGSPPGTKTLLTDIDQFPRSSGLVQNTNNQPDHSAHILHAHL